MEHGKIVAHDAPENLKHKYTGTEIDIVCTQIKSLEATLRKRKISYQKYENKLVFHTKKAPTALEILSAHKTTITDFKVKKRNAEQKCSRQLRKRRFEKDEPNYNNCTKKFTELCQE